MSGLREDAERGEFMERSKIMVGRSPNGRDGRPAPLWWRITIYAGDTQQDINVALEEALRVDGLLLARNEES